MANKPVWSSRKNPAVSIVTWLTAILGTALMTALILLGGVLPYYYTFDPLGWGAKLGIIASSPQETAKPAIQPGRQNVQTAPNQQNMALLQSAPSAEDPLSVREDTVDLVVPPKQGLEYRLKMERDYDLDYIWTSKGGTLDAELRGEADVKAPSKTFAKLKGGKAGKGFFIIPFNGRFGWRWQNHSGQPVTLRLTTKGHYEVIGQVNP